ncbi:unnamed protein product [Clavelina lepadiformis]|uniref:Uncharacterized protein n=1 Tax=Clavelina lepadiformis TaxID=159417 RepID=A0ABP0FXY1_CLALP
MKADERTYEVLVSSKDGDVSQSEEDPIRDVIWILIPAFLYCFCSTGSRLLYLDLSFAVAKCSSLNFSTSNAAWIRSLSSIGNGVGRFSGIILASHVKPVYIVATVATSSFLSMVTMALVARSWPAIMWAVSFFYGSFHGLMVPSVITWVSEITNVSGAYAFVFTFAGALGAMTVLPVGGAMFHLSPFNVVYFLCGLNAFNLICFGAIWIVAKMKKPKESEQGTGSDECKQ